MNSSADSPGIRSASMEPGLVRDLRERIRRITPLAISGSVSRIIGNTVSVAGFPVSLGAVCSIHRESGPAIDAEVVGFQSSETLLVPYGQLTGVRTGNRVDLCESVPVARVGNGLLGRVLDGRGQFVDGGPETVLPHRVSLMGDSVSPLSRPRIDSPFSTGIRAIDGLLTCGRGQRLGIFAGSGVGKSTLLGQMARGSSADVNVVVLVGERGREVREFIERDLGPDGLSRSIVVVATSDEPALMRLRAAYLGTSIAEYFRDLGKDVLLMMDSVTRFALAQRELGLAAGEPPATRGYPPSVFSLLPRLLERSGRTSRGSITGFYTVLVEGDDANEPVSDTVRGILDGHIMLTRALGERAHWPAIDVMTSTSRSFHDVTQPPQRQAAQLLKSLIAEYRQAEDLISIGAYRPGTNRRVDRVIQFQDQIQEFLCQDSTDHQAYDQTCRELVRLADLLRADDTESCRTDGGEREAA